MPRRPRGEPRTTTADMNNILLLEDLPEIRAQLSLRPGDYNPHAVPCCNRFAYCC